MPEQFYGEFSRLVPPLAIGDRLFGAVVRFNSNPAKPDTPHSVCSGVFALDPETLTGELKRVVARRAFLFDSFTIVEGFGNSWEQIVPVLCGGNICQTTEPQRLYSFANDRAFRGSDALDRAQPGDVLWWNGRAFLIVSCTAFGYAPEEVTWQGDTNLPTTYYRDVSPNLVKLNPPDTAAPNDGARIHFPVGHEGVFADCGLYAGVDPGSLSPMVRRIFDGAEDPDPYLYPPDASFADDEAEYWVHPSTFEFRLGSYTEEAGDSLGALYYHRGLLESANGGATFFVIEGTGNGYGISGGTEDSICLVATITRGDFSQEFRIHKGAANEYGTGSVEWRVGSEPDDAFVAMTWENGTISGVGKRPAKGEPLEAVSFTANEDPFTAGEFWVRVAKTAGAIEVAWSEDGDTWTVAATVTLADVEVVTEGNLGAATWDAQAIKVLGWIETETLRLLPFSPGTLSRTTFQFWEDVAYSETVRLPGDTAVLSIEYEHTKADGSVELVPMYDNDGEPRRRDWYQIDGDDITFRSETSGDRVKIVHEAEGGSPATPGRPPRMPNATNMAAGGTNVSQNVANHMDMLGVHDPFGELTAEAGEAFEIRRDPVFSSLEPPTFEYDAKGDGGSDWQEIPEESCLVRPVEGLLLLEVDWLATFEADPCFRAIGEGFSQAGNMHARQLNDQAAAVDAFDECWIGIGVSGSNNGISGVAETPQEIASGFECVSCGVVDRTGMHIGRRDRAGWFEEVEALLARGASYPYWREYFGAVIGRRYVAFEDVMEYTSANFDVPHVCCPGNPVTNSWNEKGVGTSGIRVDIFPFNAIASPQKFGAGLILGSPGAPDVDNAVFSFLGADLDPKGIIPRLPDGAVCVAAYMPITFSGLSSMNYSGRRWMLHGIGPSGPLPTNTYLNEYYLNGLLKEREHYVEGALIESVSYDDEEVPPTTNEAAMSFVLMGRRRNSRNVFLPLAGTAGEFRTVPDGDWESLGASVAVGGTAVSGKQRLVDVTAVVNAAIAASRRKITDLQLWPARAGVEPGDSPDAMRAYAEALVPKFEVTDVVTGTGTSRIHELNVTFEGQLTTWTGVSFGGIVAKFRCASGTIDRVVIPINWPRMIA